MSRTCDKLLQAVILAAHRRPSSTDPDWFPVTQRSPVSDRPRAGANPAAAGAMLLAAIVSAGAAGFGLGSLIGAAVPLGLAGVFAGFIGGLALVYASYRRI